MTHLLQLLIAGVALAVSGAAETPTAVNEATTAEASAGFDTDPLAAATALPEAITPTGYLLLPRVGDYRRAPLHVDPIEAAVAKDHEDWPAPTAGDTVRSSEGKLIPWFAETDPLPLSALSGGYAYAEFDSPASGILLLEAPGCAAVWLNGEWIVGDPYGTGWFRPPVNVREGTNRLLLHLAQPTARAKFVKPPADVFLIVEQATLPDILTSEKEAAMFGSVPLVNATDEPLEGLEVRIGEGGPVRKLPTIAPRMIVPITFTIPAVKEKETAEGETSAVKIQLTVRQIEKLEPSEEDTAEEDAKEADTEESEKIEPTFRTVVTTDLTLRLAEASRPHVRTYVSSVDGSVQPYTVLPATDIPTEDSSATEETLPGVLLVLHDAGEDHAAAAKQCQPLSDLHVVLPGGRGAYGFDWEDWSATDALEALTDFASRTPVDGNRISVTGHGMGGHGAIYLGTIAPDRFAAVAPAEAWLSFYTQGSARPLPVDATPIETVLARRASAADPLRALENLARTGISVAHNQNDQAVSLAESHLLRRRLSEFHTDFAYRESKEAGAVCPGSPLVAFCRSHRRTPAEQRSTIDFATHNLGLLAELGWAQVEGQRVQGDLSRVHLKRDLAKRTITGTTDNVSHLTLRLDGFEPDKPVTVRLDGSQPIEFDWPRRGGGLRLERDDTGHWKKSLGTRQRRANKRSERPGGFKSVFANNPLLVYGTLGDEEAQRWSLAKARYDAMMFLYRGAGRLEMIADTEFTLTRELGRNVVLYGSETTNKSLKALFGRSPVKVADGQVDVGLRPEQGENLGALLIRPRPGSSTASIALVGGTGPVGRRSTTRLRYFWSGVAYPDFLMYGAGALDTGSLDTEEESSEDRFRGEVRAAGDFGADWKIETGDIPWRDMAL